MQLTLDGLGASASSLQSADPTQWPVAPGWQNLVQAFFDSRPGLQLLHFLKQCLTSGQTIYPIQPLTALAWTPPETVRLVILGQDPYHGPGQAQGLAFSVPSGVPIPPSLRNIFLELGRDLGATAPLFPVPGGDLQRWARTGVLLLNTCLTVEQGRPASHAGQGWEALTDQVLSRLSEGEERAVFMLWGAHAQSKRRLIDGRRHLILTANHPSPLSARRGPEPFVGCGHFSKALDWLAMQGKPVADLRTVLGQY